MAVMVWVRCNVDLRDRPKFGFGHGAETGDIFIVGNSRNREELFWPTFGYGWNYD